MTLSSNPSRPPGLYTKWRYVVDSLESIIPIYETTSSRIALFSDRIMRDQVVSVAVRRGGSVLDLGAGPGTLTRLVEAAGGRPVMLDVSRRMLLSSPRERDKVQATFESLPFREGTFDSAVAGFALRDSRDQVAALGEIRRAIKRGGVFAFCDLGKPDSAVERLTIAFYFRAIVPLIGLVSGGRTGLGFASLYSTFLLTLRNESLGELLEHFFSDVKFTKRQLGASIVVECVA